MERPPFYSLSYYQEHLEAGETILWGRNRSREDILTWILNLIQKMNWNLKRSLIFGVPLFLVGVILFQLFFQGIHPGDLELTTEQYIYLAYGFILVCVDGITPISRPSDVLPHRYYGRLKEYYRTGGPSEEFTLLTTQRLIHRGPAIADPVLYSWTGFWQWRRIWNKQLEVELSEPLARLSSIEIAKVKRQTLLTLWTVRGAPEGYLPSGFYARHNMLSNAYPILLFFPTADEAGAFLDHLTKIRPNLLIEGRLR